MAKMAAVILMMASALVQAGGLIPGTSRAYDLAPGGQAQIWFAGSVSKAAPSIVTGRTCVVGHYVQLDERIIRVALNNLCNARVQGVVSLAR